LLLTLNLPVEEGGPLPPLKINWEPPDAKGPPAPPPFPGPPRLVPSPPDETVPASIMADEWLALDAAKLIESLSQQKDRPGRIRVPTWDEVKKNAPPGYPTDRPTRIKWSLVCMGHLPELTAPWLTCMRTFGRESDQNRIFEESMFWVITRSLHCYY
jgi:hypothetical protein